MKECFSIFVSLLSLTPVYDNVNVSDAEIMDGHNTYATQVLERVRIKVLLQGTSLDGGRDSTR